MLNVYCFGRKVNSGSNENDFLIYKMIGELKCLAALNKICWKFQHVLTFSNGALRAQDITRHPKTHLLGPYNAIQYSRIYYEQVS